MSHESYAGAPVLVRQSHVADVDVPCPMSQTSQGTHIDEQRNLYALRTAVYPIEGSYNNSKETYLHLKEPCMLSKKALYSLKTAHLALIRAIFPLTRALHALKTALFALKRTHYAMKRAHYARIRALHTFCKSFHFCGVNIIYNKTGHECLV